MDERLFPVAQDMPRVILIAGGSRHPMAGEVVLDCRALTAETVHGKVRLPRTLFRIATAVLAAGGYGLSSHDLFDAVYGDRADGGPFDKALMVNISRLRQHFARIGLLITHRLRSGVGYLAHFASDPFGSGGSWGRTAGAPPGPPPPVGARPFRCGAPCAALSSPSMK